MLGPSNRLLRVFQLSLWSLLFYFFARLEFFLWNKTQWQAQSVSDIFLAFVAGVRFDISAILALMAPLILLAMVPWPFRLQKLWAFCTFVGIVLIQIPFLVLNLVDTEFINFVGRRFTHDSLFLTQELTGKLSQFVATYWLLFLINTLLVAVYAWGGFKIVYRPQKEKWRLRQLGGKAWLGHGLISFLALAVAVLGIRGGTQGKPLSFVNANLFQVPMMNNMVLNSSFTFIKSYGLKELPVKSYFADETEMLRLLNGAIQGSALSESIRRPQSNIVLIVLESFGSEYMGPDKDGKSFTPFLDELRAQSLDFKNAFANGRRSIEGIAAALAEIPALMQEPFISSQYTSNHFTGIGSRLLQEGYTTSFFHGGRNGTMHFDVFMPSVGVTNYFGATEYNNSKDDDGVWGIWDEPFLQWMLTQLNKTSEPFFSTVFTLSSHHPFRVPSQYEGQFPEGELPILKTVAYTDMALRKFFDGARQMPWYENTLFIITADHTSLHYRKDFENEWGNYSVPLILYHPKQDLPQETNHLPAQHIDIPATILDYLGLPEGEEKNFLSSSLFALGDKVVVNFIDGRYVLFAEDYQLYWWPHEEKPRVYAMEDHSLQAELLELTDTEVERVEWLFKKMRAVIQYFNNGIMNNRLYYPSSAVE